jgi:hypothetical protein
VTAVDQIFELIPANFLRPFLVVRAIECLPAAAPGLQYPRVLICKKSSSGKFS